MKKNIMKMFVAAGLLLAASCSENLFVADASDERVDVTFSIGIEGQAQNRTSVADGDDTIVDNEGNIIEGDDYNGETRFSDGTRATHVIYAIYEINGTEVTPAEDITIEGTNLGDGRYEIKEAKFPLSISLKYLLKNKQYKIVFWAQSPDAEKYYDISNLERIRINYNVASASNSEGEINNDEMRDVFCASEIIDTDVMNNRSKEIILKRPLAQINVGISEKEWETIEAANTTIEESTIKIAYVGNTFNLINNTAVIGNTTYVNEDGNTVTEGMTVADYQYYTIPASQKEIGGKDISNNGNTLWIQKEGETEPTGYKWLSMSYILAPTEGNDKVTVDIAELKFKTKNNEELQPFPNGLDNVPVQRNHRTNIIGNLLTTKLEYQVLIDNNFAGDFNYYDEQWHGEIADGVSYSEKLGGSIYGGNLRSGLNFYVSSAKGLQWLADRSNKKPLVADDIPAWFTTSESDKLAAYKKFVLDIINNRSFIDYGVTEARFNNNDPWTYDECTIYLTKDIDWTAEMGTKPFRPFSMNHGTAGGTGVNHTGTFKGEFDGQNHTISNLTINTHNNNPASNGAFIAAATDSPILRNLRLYAADIKANWNVGGFVGRYDSASGMITMENCLLENSKIHAEVGNSPSEDANIGGLIGVVVGNKTNEIRNCHVRNTRLESAYVAGGLFGLCIKNTTVEDCSISDVAVIINEMSAVGDKMDIPVDNILIDDYWLCGTSKDNITATNVQHNNVVRSVFYGTRERSADKGKDGIGEIDRLPLHWFPELYGEWANGIKLMSHITGTTSYNSVDQNWCAGLYIDTQHTGKNNVKNNTADYILSGDVREDKPLYAINVQNPDAEKTCYGVYMTGEYTATIKNIVINGDPSITAGIYLDKAKDVVLNNVAVYDVENTISDNSNQSGASLSVTNCDLRGTTRYGSGYSSVTFSSTIFSKGSGTTSNMNNKSVIPGSATTFEECVFRSGFKVDLSQLANGQQVTFKNCKIGDAGKEIDLTSDNIKELVEEADDSKYTIE